MARQAPPSRTPWTRYPEKTCATAAAHWSSSSLSRLFRVVVSTRQMFFFLIWSWMFKIIFRLSVGLSAEVGVVFL